MKVVHVSTSDMGHGAALAAYRLFNAQRQAGLDVTMLVSEKITDDPDVHLIFPEATSGIKGGLTRMLRYFERGANACGPQGLVSAASLRLLFDWRLWGADVVHLHNIHWHDRCLSLLLLPILTTIRPVVWTLHDMWAITGHCIASRDCDRWRQGCGRCPYPDTYIGLAWDSSHFQCVIKTMIYRCSNFTVVTPSSWLARQVADSPLMNGKRVRTVNNSVDQSIFFPRDRAQSRESIGVTDSGVRIVMFVAAFIDDPIKGYEYFEDAMLKLKYDGLDNTVLVVVGRGKASNRLHQEFRVIEPGYQLERANMASLYSAADIYVMPSISDNFPGVVLESLACGTPVAAFATGGIPEMIVHLVTGYIAPQRDVGELARGISTLLHAPDPDKIREACAKTVTRCFSEEEQVKDYIKIYRESMGI